MKKHTISSDNAQSMFQNMNMFHCNICNTDLRCCTGGINNVEKHVNKAKHEESAAAVRSKFHYLLMF